MANDPSLHPTDRTLSSYGLGELDDLWAEAIKKHLDGCPDCQNRLAAFSADKPIDRSRGAQAAGKSLFGQSPSEGVQRSRGPSAPPPSPPPAETLPPGLAEHPDYEIKRELGRGGMGVVYLAHNRLLGRDEVLKVMGPQVMERPGVLERFLREIRAVAKLRHPNIVTAYSALRIGEILVLAMEYVEGLDLARMVKAKGALPVAHSCNFVQQAALGLQHAHEHGLVHRDIKPGNLMLARAGDKPIVKVLDFGLAKATCEQTVDHGLTSEGQALGTPDYIAPEQILDAPSADVRADIYSLGGTLYHLLTGRPPFKANSLYDIYQAHISREAELLNVLRPEVPAELAALVAKMMAKEPSRRFQTPAEVAQALAPFLRKTSVAFDSSRAEMSQSGQTMPEVGPIRQASEPSVADLPQGLTIEQPAAGGSHEAMPAVAPRRRPPLRWARLAAAVILLGLVVVLLFQVVRLRTGEGDIVLQGLPEDSVITVDGKVCTVNERTEAATSGKHNARITVRGGDHRVRVEVNGALVHGEDISIESGQLKFMTVRFEPAVVASKEPENPVAANGLWFDEGTRLAVAGSNAFDLTHRDFTIFARVKSKSGGTIFSKSEAGDWAPGGSTLFIRGGKLGFDIGWVGVVGSNRRIDDDRWHDVAVTRTHEDGRVVLYVDRIRVGEGKLVSKTAPPNHVVRIGYTAPIGSPAQYFEGSIAQVRFYQRALTTEQIFALAEQEPDGEAAVARWRLGLTGATIVADETGHGHDGRIEIGKETIKPLRYDALLGEFAPGFSVKAFGRIGTTGLAIEKEHFGRPRVLRTHPVTQQTPCVLQSTIEVPADKQTTLVLDVSHNRWGDWRLVVKANDQVLHSSAVGRGTTRNGWAEVRVDLSPFAGQKVKLELLNQATGWRWEYGYWGRIGVISEADSGGLVPRPATGRPT